MNKKDLLLEEALVEILNEMPIKTFQKIGDFSKNSSFKKTDRAILNSPKGEAKIKRLFEKTKHDFNFYFVNLPRLNKAEFREVGILNPNQLEELGLNIEPDPDAITVIYNGNYGAEKVPMTAWTIAHRFGHAMAASGRFARTDVGEAWRQVTLIINKLLGEIAWAYHVQLEKNSYGGSFNQRGERKARYIAQAIGTFKSARDGKLRTVYEFPYELLAQYLITGRVRFNKLPLQMIVGYAGWGRHETRSLRRDIYLPGLESMLEQEKDRIQAAIEYAIRLSKGKVFLM